jgi:hypothetical protein
MKRNALEWVCGRMRDATSAVVLTHNIDFLFLQSILWPRLKACGHPRLTIFADAMCVAGTYAQQRPFIDGLGQHYRVVPVDMGTGRRFHPKAIFLAGPTKAVLAVGSGNLTHGGWSANREIWATYDSAETAGAEIAAFRDYLGVILDLVESGNALSDEVLSAFEPGNAWAANLAPSDGLLGTPADRSLLDRIIDLAGPNVEHATLCAPYYDPGGVALSEIARRLPSASVDALLQRRYVGLARSAAEARPANVTLHSVDTDPHRFIHAKIFAFRRTDDTLLVAGSANLSRAALTATLAWGNAELVAARTVHHDEAQSLLADIVVQSSAPEFPEQPPADQWETASSPLRIVAARFSDGILHIAIAADGTMRVVEVELEDGTIVPCQATSVAHQVKVTLARCPRAVRVRAISGGNTETASSFWWVDDEGKLSVSALERRIAAKVAQAVDAGGLSAAGMLEILQLLHQHIQTPASGGAHGSSSPAKPHAPIVAYSIDDIFSDDFGRAQSAASGGLRSGFHERDFLAAFSSYFADVDHQVTDEALPGPQRSPDDPEENERKSATAETQPLDPADDRVELGRKLRGKFVDVVSKIAAAMNSDAFLVHRSAERLGGDICAVALLLRKGLADGVLSNEDFSKFTTALWEILFFGTAGGEGAIPRRLRDLGDEADEFASRLVSPRLTAALVLWCLPQWRKSGQGTSRFRLTAALMAATLPALLQGGEPAAVAAELRRLSRSIAAEATFEALLSGWQDWLRAGVALNEFVNFARQKTPAELRELVSVPDVRRGALLWQFGELCTAEAEYRRELRVKATVLSIRGSEARKVAGSFLAPVSYLLRSSEFMMLREPVRVTVAGMAAEIEADIM